MRDFSRKMMSIGVAVLAVGSLSACIDQSTAPSSNLVAAPAAPKVSAVDPLAGCPNFAADSVWHRKINALPVDRNSTAFKNGLGGEKLPLTVAVTSQVWEGSRPGFPINVVNTASGSVPMEPIFYDGALGAAEKSYKGAFPWAYDLRIEGDPLPPLLTRPWDDHVITVDKKDCSVYEVFKLNVGWYFVFGTKHAMSGARWNLADGKTKGFGTNAAQVPYTAITTRLAEVQRGLIDHPIGACTNRASNQFVWPAQGADGKNAAGPPMGSRLRLKADRLSRFKAGSQSAVFATAMTDYGVMIYDTCGDMNEPPKLHITSENVASGWDDGDLAALKTLTLADFDFVDQTPLKISDASWAVK